MHQMTYLRYGFYKGVNVKALSKLLVRANVNATYNIYTATDSTKCTPLSPPNVDKKQRTLCWHAITRK